MSVNLNQSLYNIADALNLHSRAIEVVGQNIANANNPDYACRKIRISASPTMAIARGSKGGTFGVLDLRVVTERNAIVDHQIVRSDMRVGRLASEAENNKLLESMLGESFQLNAQGSVEAGDDFVTRGMAYDIRQFFNACSSLGAMPTASSEKLNVIAKGQDLVDSVRYLGKRFTEMQENLSAKMAEEVNQVNLILKEIALQTQKINTFEMPDDLDKAFELRENRQANLEKLAKLLNFEVTETGENNFFKISVGGIDILECGKVKGTLTFDGTHLRTGTQEIHPQQGSMAGILYVKDTRIADMRADLNTWVNNFVTRINTAYDMNHDGATLFSGNSIDNFAFTATLNNLQTGSSAANPDANDRINAVIRVQDEKIDDATLEESYRSFVVKTAQAFRSTENELESENMVQKMLTQQRDNRIGVSIDSEMVNLIKSQKAFTAAAKIVVLIDELLETSINLV